MCFYKFSLSYVALKPILLASKTSSPPLHTPKTPPLNSPPPLELDTHVPLLRFLLQRSPLLQSAPPLFSSTFRTKGEGREDQICNSSPAPLRFEKLNPVRSDSFKFGFNGLLESLPLALLLELLRERHRLCSERVGEV